MDESKIAWVLLHLAVLVFSLCLHEFGHAFAADRLGDPTPRLLGRLTLDPRSHVDPIGTLLFPLLMLLSPVVGSFLIGWAKPVPVTPENFRVPKRDDILVSVAGPAANLLLFALALGGLFFLYHGDWEAAPKALFDLLWAFALMNFFLAFFNLLPIPPLDGSWVLKALLPDPLAYRYSRLYPYGNMILLALLWTGALRVLFTPGRMLLTGILEALGIGRVA